MSEAMTIALIGGAVSLCTAIIPKLIDHTSGIGKDIKDIKNDVSQLKKDTSMNSDMVYQILDHLSSQNNSGEMKRALTEYNKYFRQS